MASDPSMIPKDRLAFYDRLIASRPEIERKGKTMPYTSLNGHMFSILDKTGVMGLRLPRAERERFLETYDSTLYEQYGSVMREYVMVPGQLLEDTEALATYLDMSVEYVRSLKPRPAARKNMV